MLNRRPTEVVLQILQRIMATLLAGNLSKVGFINVWAHVLKNRFGMHEQRQSLAQLR